MEIVIVDDSEHFLERARAVLETDGISVIGVASTAAEAVERIEVLRPDVALVDIDLGDESGFDVARRLASAPNLACGVIMVSSHAQEDFNDLVEASSAIGFVSKSNLSASAIYEVLGESRADV